MEAHSKDHLAIFLSSLTTNCSRRSWSILATATIEKQPRNWIIGEGRLLLRTLYISVAVWYSTESELREMFCSGTLQYASRGSMDRILTLTVVEGSFGVPMGFSLKCFLIFFFIPSNLSVISSSSLSFLFSLAGAPLSFGTVIVARATRVAAHLLLQLRLFSRHDVHDFHRSCVGIWPRLHLEQPRISLWLMEATIGEVVGKLLEIGEEDCAITVEDIAMVE